MKKHKRNKAERAFNHGYLAGARGASMDNCPHTSVVDSRGAWLGGWREGRSQFLSGYIEAISIK